MSWPSRYYRRRKSRKNKELLGDVEFFNGASSLAKHLKDILEEKDLISDSKIKGTVEFVDSSNSEYKKERFLRQLGQA